MGATTTKTCPADIPCMYESEQKGTIVTMKCSPDPMPGVTMDTTICHTSQHGSHIKCYCMKDNCNDECTLKKDADGKCQDKPNSTPGVNDADILCATLDCTCPGSTCMAKAADGMSTTMTMKTMKTGNDTEMKTTKMKSKAPPPATTIKTMVETSPKMMDATSKSSTTNAAAFHVVIGMVIIITKHFP